jgi:hypothetical protein
LSELTTGQGAGARPTEVIGSHIEVLQVGEMLGSGDRRVANLRRVGLTRLAI